MKGLPLPKPIPMKDRAQLVFVERAQLDVKDGAFVAMNAHGTRERIWKQVEMGIESGDAVMIWRAPTDQGYAFATVRDNRRLPVDFDGLTLVYFLRK